MRKYHKKAPSETRNCRQCGGLFVISAGRKRAAKIRGGLSGQFCSRNCFLDFSSVSVSCAYCGKVFKRSRCFASRYKGKNFCSRTCNNISRIRPERLTVKRRRYGTAEWEKARLAAIERDGVCQICKNAVARSVHHKNWDPYDNRLENLTLLCKPCHGRVKRNEDFDFAKLRIGRIVSIILSEPSD